MAAAAAKRGLFVLFEGVDRCGKTTQARRLVEALNTRGEKAVFMRFPGEFSCKLVGCCPYYYSFACAVTTSFSFCPSDAAPADRDTTIGTMINSYLTKAAELDDHAVHLLFAANRWEKKCVTGAGAERQCSLCNTSSLSWQDPFENLFPAGMRSWALCGRARMW